MSHKFITISLIVIASIILIIGLLVVIIYSYPLRNSQLQGSQAKPLSYAAAVAEVGAINKSEYGSQNVLANNGTILMTHGTKTAKTVVMLHGITSNPTQFKELGQKFFDAGYNVYIPLVPYHGTADKKQHGKLDARDLTSYITKSFNIADGLGDEVGLVGLSGGGNLGTWALEYRPEIKHAVLLAPFYEPAATKAPKWQLQFLNVLYGYGILPDTFIQSGDAYFSYHALANYNIVAKNLKKDPSGLTLETLALVNTPVDDQIDLDVAYKIPREIAAANKSMTYVETTLPRAWNVPHDMVGTTHKEVIAHQTELYNLFFNSYEGKQTQL